MATQGGEAKPEIKKANGGGKGGVYIEKLIV